MTLNDLALEYNALLKKADEEIDFTDIPELDFDYLGKPEIGKFYGKKNLVIMIIGSSC